MYITGDGVAILKSKAKVNGISSVRSTFSTLFGRWQQQCGLSLPALRQPVILIIKLANSQNLLAVFQQKPRCTRAASCPFSVYSVITPPPIWERRIVISVSVCVCVSVCPPRSYPRNCTSGTRRIFFLHVTVAQVGGVAQW